jgi:hypothetical protein
MKNFICFCILSAVFCLGATTAHSQVPIAVTPSSPESLSDGFFLFGNWSADTMYLITAKNKKRRVASDDDYIFRLGMTGDITYSTGFSNSTFYIDNKFNWVYSKKDSTLTLTIKTKKRSFTTQVWHLINHISSNHIDMIIYEDSSKVKNGAIPRITQERFLSKF